jgi:hydroxypyruvate isomerase
VPKFSANLSFLYPDLPFTERFGAAARDGFKAVEYVGPYAEPKEKIAALLERHGLTQALFNLPAGNWDGGERGIGCLPDRIGEFRTGVATAIEYAEALGCKTLNALAGIAPPGVDQAILEETFVNNLEFAANKCEQAAIKLVFEPINTRDIPGFFVSTTNHAERIIAQTNVANLFIQYDFYHMQVMQGDLIPTFARLQHRVGHVQIADSPGRHEPGTGEINYRFIFNELDRLGYDGWVGCEYKPKAGFAWIKPYLTSGEPS